MKKRLAFFVVLMFTVVLSAVAAEANGTITATVLYSGQPVSGAYMYLQSGSQLSPRELYYHNASYILGPSNASGIISASVPAGAYYVRITKRTGSGVSYLGPPYPGDYIWIYAANPPTVTVTDNGTLALGTVSATSYETITLSGTVKGASGKVLAGWAVKAATVPCESGNWSYAHSLCASRGARRLSPLCAALHTSSSSYQTLLPLLEFHIRDFSLCLRPNNRGQRRSHRLPPWKRR